MIRDKISTGIPGLDDVLFGGIPANTITVIMGAPGTGKTILAEQLAFANASYGSPALYLTTLSEPLEKFIAHGHHYDFFDTAKIGETIFYEDLGLIVREQGITSLAAAVTDLITARSPKFVFIDSFKSLNELFTSPAERRTVVYDMASVLSSYECTSFLVGEYASEMMTDLPEFAITDVVLQLIKYSTNQREQRFLRVEKLRGSNSRPGMHAFSISNAGIELYPRLLTPDVAPNYLERIERVSTGVAGLDEMIGEGFWRGSSTLVAGPTGSGKTVLCMHFICDGADKGEPGLFLGLQENPTQLARSMQNFGWDPQKLLNDGFELMYRSPVEVQLDSIATELFRRVRDNRVKRVVIDALGDLERSSIDPQRFADFTYALTQWFAAQNVTCLMTYELNDLFEVHSISNQEVSNMSDNILLLRLTPGAEMERTVRVVKTRGSAHDSNEHTLQITEKGLIVKRA
ncbi:MAG TPA: ATPase domain-containing protein [Pyrinomonadaceae bacterium]|nr:ATPase domain-containing protein [Pyrinomonadaceae bacterium]